MTKIYKMVIFLLVFMLGFFTSSGKSKNPGINEREIECLRADILTEGLSWEAGETSMILLTPEQRAMRLGALIPFIDERKEKPAYIVPVQVPAALDWRTSGGRNWLTPIRNQGQCGSCWAFGAVAIVEAKYKIQTRNYTINPDFSEQHLLSCTGGGSSCSGGYPSAALEYIRATGASYETCFPYRAADIACNPCASWQTNHGRVKIATWAWVTLSIENRTAILNALQGGPVAAYMMVYGDFFYYRSGVYKKTASAQAAGGHLVAIVGYNNNSRYWICKNSWGTGWGEKGFFRIAYGQVMIGTWVLKAAGVSISN